MSDSESEFFAHAAMVRDYASMSLSEADTREHLIDPVLNVLGYRALADVRREVPVAASREFVDYQLLVGGNPVAIVEAKSVKHSVTDQDAAQCVQYATILGVRWCLITNGVSWLVYDAHAKGPLAAKRVAQVRLDGDTPAVQKAWAVLALFAHASIECDPPLTKLIVERVVADELSRGDSPAIGALRRVVKERFGQSVTTQTVVDAIQQMLVGSRPRVGSTVPGCVPNDRRPARRATTAPRSGLAELIDAELLPADAALECKLYGVTHAARVRDGVIELEGKAYATPSAAAAVLRGGKASNGWVIWRYRGETLADLRARVRTGAQEPQEFTT